MERSTAVGPQAPIDNEHAASELHIASSRLLQWSLLALAAGGVSYVAGFQRLWSGRVVKLALLGSAIGGLGAHLSQPSRLDNLLGDIGRDLDEHCEKNQAALKEMQEALGEDFDPEQPANELAKRLERRGKGSAALDTYLRYHGASVSDADCLVMDSWKRSTLMICDMNRLFGRDHGRDHEISPLFRKAFLGILEMQTQQVVVEIRGKLEEAVFFLDLLQGQNGLVSIDCSDKGDEEAAKKLMELLDTCPKLAEVPHDSRKGAEQRYAWSIGRERILVNLIDKLEAKQRNLKEAAKN